MGPSWALGGVLGAIFIDFLIDFGSLSGHVLDILGRSWGTFWALLGTLAECVRKTSD